MTLVTTAPKDHGFAAGSVLLGIALGGFFDGILLHQILQWHHLLSAVEGDPFRDLRVQILADGLFHALMYVLAAGGLWRLWRHGRDRGSLAAGALLGFGLWHVLDGIVSHWLLGIHHVRMDSDRRLAWDLAFFVAGAACALAGWRWAAREAGRGGGAGGARGAAALSLAVLSAGAVAGRPSDGAAVLFPRGIDPARAFAAAAEADARVVALSRRGDVLFVRMEEPRGALAFYRHGALFVVGGPMGAACLPPPGA